jgi:hypothetical protein
VKVSFTVPDPDRVTEQDLALARKLAATVTRYLAELEKFAASTAPAGEPTGQAA